MPKNVLVELIENNLAGHGVGWHKIFFQIDVENEKKIQFYGASDGVVQHTVEFSAA